MFAMLLTQARRLERLAEERLKDFPKDEPGNSDDQVCNGGARVT